MKLLEILSDDKAKLWISSLDGSMRRQLSLVGGTVRVRSGTTVYLNHHNLTELPVKFASAPSSSFLIHSNELTTLIGCPSRCKEFDADYNNLTSLEGGPTEVPGGYSVSHNLLTSLKGSPIFVGDDFNCNDNALTEIDAAPTTILGNWDLRNNKIETLHNIHKHCRRCNGSISINGNPIKRDLLGLVLIEGLEKVNVDNDKTSLVKAIAIINKHLGLGQPGVLAAQEELIDADLDDYAEL